MAAAEMQENLPRSPGREVDPFVECILSKIIHSDVTIKSQQKDEPDLTFDEKFAYLKELLTDSTSTFLYRFGHILDIGHLTYFDGLPQSYELELQLRDLRKHLDPKQRKIATRNRRFVHMEKQLEKGTYFEEDAMRSRNPLLFEHYVGQYMTEEEREQNDKKLSDVLWSAHILRAIDKEERRAQLEQQLEEEDCMLEESDDSSSESEDAEDEASKRNIIGVPNIQISDNPDTAAKEKKMLKKEFYQAMQQSFLSGDDKDIDYSYIDADRELDLSKTQEWDDVDAYFDEDGQTSVDQMDQQ